MGKKELVEKDQFEKAVGIKGTFSGSFLSILKFVISIVLFPLVVGLSKGFFIKIIRQPQYVRNNFMFAAGLYLILHLFVLEPKNLYDLGQRIVGKLFSFFVPLRRITYHCLPFYTTLFFVLFLIFKAMFGHKEVIGYFIFLMSFSAIMHLLITSIYLKGEAQSVIKGDYFLSLTFVYLFGIILFCGFLSVMVENFSFINTIKYGYKFFMDTHTSIWKQFFVVR